ncbi:MAG TPA: FmdB family transcriptional regulator [Legionella sp.]|nr:FmdB family transcriptional regulator [Legionella sp.]
MPIYEYQCSGCHHAFDVIQKMSDEPVKICPVCLEETAVKLVSAAGFQLKGTGWYATDFKSKSPSEVKTDNKACRSSEKKAAESSSSSSISTESKST